MKPQKSLCSRKYFLKANEEAFVLFRDSLEEDVFRVMGVHQEVRPHTDSIDLNTSAISRFYVRDHRIDIISLFTI